MKLIPFPADPTRREADRIAQSTIYRLKAAALGRLMEEERDID